MRKFTTAGELYSLDAQECSRQVYERRRADRHYGKPGMKVLKLKFYPRDRTLFNIIDREDNYLFERILNEGD